MRCTDPLSARRPSGSAVARAVALLLAMGAGGCSQAPDPAATPGAPAASGTRAPVAGPLTAAQGPAKTGAAVPTPGLPRRTAPDWDGYRQQAARRIVALNPGATYDGPVPEPLLAIPVLEIELDADGSVRRIGVLRQPGQAADTVPLAMAAVRRAAPFGSVVHLPRPWKFTETFLFDDQRRFKPRSLDT